MYRRSRRYARDHADSIALTSRDRFETVSRLLGRPTLYTNSQHVGLGGNVKKQGLRFRHLTEQNLNFGLECY